MIKLIHGDSLEQMKKLEDNSVDAIVTDPPYGLSFMGKKWDIDVPSVEIWQEAYRVLKHGGHLISFGGTRTYHRMAVAIEDAGFEIRDMVSWIYGSGFPKSLNIGKAVDKLQGNEREVLPPKTFPDGIKDRKTAIHKFYADEEEQKNTYTNTKGNSPWEGWGTALKPAQEPCVLARKPLSEKTVAENVLKWGTGGLNIDGSRVGTEKRINNANGKTAGGARIQQLKAGVGGGEVAGRFPANIIHDGSDEVLEVFPETNKAKASKRGANRNGDIYGKYGLNDTVRGHNDNGGSASRFFYCAKASKRERTSNGTVNNGHPTIKPITLMEYMVKLITPPNGTVLDPFMGSGSTGVACKNLGYKFIGIELDEEYLEIAKARIGV